MEKVRTMSCVQQSRRERYPVQVAATVVVADGEPTPCILENISQDGCRLVTDGTLPIGAPVEIHEDRLGTLHGTIRWALLGEAGCRFIHAA